MKKIYKGIVLILSLGLIIVSFCSCGKCKDDKHNFGAKTIKESTCTSEGLIHKTCTKCGYEEDETVPALEHIYRVVSVTATCTEPGKTTYKCYRCNDTYEEDATALGHKWVEATCKEAKHCSGCGITEGSKISHNYVNGSCSMCGEQHTKTISCQGVNFIVPVEAITDNYDTKTKFSITNITFERAFEGYSSFYVYYSAECIEKADFKNGFDYALYDSNGYVVTTGFEYAPELKEGEKCKDQSFEIQLEHINGSDLQKGATYTLKITSFK